MANQLVSMSSAEIAEITKGLPVEKRSAWGKALRAAAKHLKASKGDYSKAFELSCCMVRNCWHLGVALRQIEFDKGAAEKRSKRSRPGDRVTISDLGLNKSHSSRCQALAEKFEAAELDEYLKSLYDEASFKLAALRPSVDAVHVSKNTGEPEWYTPSEFIESARAVLGGIDLDPASSDKAQEVVQASAYFTADEDGLSKDWNGNVWMNPPYSAKLVDKFMTKFCEHFNAGDIKNAITLTNNATETSWFQSSAECCSSICFPSSRIKFLDEDGNPGAPLQGQAFMYFGRRKAAFKKEFSKHGIVFERTA